MLQTSHGPHGVGTHVPFSFTWQIGQGAWQTPFSQSAPFWQSTPHPPQLFGSFFVSTQSPQSVVPGGHTQSPFRQFLKAPLHWLPQLPQLALSDDVSTQTPLQLVSPSGHVQTPFSQDLPPVQVTPQPPQLLLSVLTSMHALPQHVCPSSKVSQQVAPHASMPAKALQHCPASLHVPPWHCWS
jgi:hypothetical protein